MKIYLTVQAIRSKRWMPVLVSTRATQVTVKVQGSQRNWHEVTHLDPGWNRSIVVQNIECNVVVPWRYDWKTDPFIYSIILSFLRCGLFYLVLQKRYWMEMWKECIRFPLPKELQSQAGHLQP